ncbi:MAG: putative addiction module component [Verrucomicrobiota bacterium]|jgi:putative addiction module component (TIGR02574 family)
MSQILEIRKAAGALSTEERAELAAFLLGSLDEVHHWADDDEASRRSEELDSGKVRGLTREEFNRACGH